MRARAQYVICALALVAATASVASQGAIDRAAAPDEERFVNVPVPNIALTTTAGHRTNLEDVAGGRPLLLALVFTRCAGVCSPFLASWRAADAWLAESAKIRRVVLSFDPRDTVDDMAGFSRHFGVDRDATWTFAVAAPDDVRRLAAAAGFWYDWDASRQQFDHPAMLAAVRDGRLIRLLVGAVVTSARLDELVREATGRFVPSYPLPGRVRFRCVQYDARTGRASLDWGFSLLFLPVGAVGLATAAMFSAGARRRRGMTAAAAAAGLSARAAESARRRSGADGTLPASAAPRR
jgi:cytochrome oxidase Cu insertion factor (SCO1/SenC/PrrC family)